MIAHVKIRSCRGDQITLVVSEISAMKWERGHSYATLIVSMKNGEQFHFQDRAYDPYDIERAILKAMEVYP